MHSEVSWPGISHVVRVILSHEYCVGFLHLRVSIVFQIRTRAVTCKQMSMITPVQLLLFASRTVSYEDGMILLDDWCVLRG